MTIRHDEEWIAIAQLDQQNYIYFTPEFRELMGDLGWEAKALVGHLLGLWYDPFEHMLDYTSGQACYTPDQPGQFDSNGLDEPQEVVEYWAEFWSQNDNAHQPTHKAGTGLTFGIEWYRDVLRAKLVSLKLPKRLLLTYRQQLLECIEKAQAN
jgi:hypothetical protein